MATWRVGRKLGRTLYKDDVVVGMVDTPELASEIVGVMNGPDDEEARKRWGLCWAEVQRERQHRDRLQARIDQLEAQPRGRVGHHPPCKAMWDSEAICTCGQ